MAKKVFSGLVTAWRLAGSPTNLSPSSVKATIEGVVRMPSAFSITLGFFPSMTATQEFVVPRSIPITFAIRSLSFWQTVRALHSAPVNADARRACKIAWRRSPNTIGAPADSSGGVSRGYIRAKHLGRKEKRWIGDRSTCVSQPRLPCRLKLHRQLASGVHIPPIPPEHPLEHSVELAHGRARRLDGDRAEIEFLCHHHASWLGPGRHFFEDGDRIAHLHEQEPAEGEVERRACRLLEFEKIGCDLLELGSAFAAEILQGLGAQRTVGLDAGDRALGPHAVGHQPHHRAWARADIEAAHAHSKPDGGKHMRRGRLPHAGLFAQTLVFSGVRVCMSLSGLALRALAMVASRVSVNA